MSVGPPLSLSPLPHPPPGVHYGEDRRGGGGGAIGRRNVEIKGNGEIRRNGELEEGGGIRKDTDFVGIPLFFFPVSSFRSSREGRKTEKDNMKRKGGKGIMCR